MAVINRNTGDLFAAVADFFRTIFNILFGWLY